MYCFFLNIIRNCKNRNENRSENRNRFLRVVSIDLQVAFKAPTTIGSLFKFKDKTPRELLSMVVYKLTCLDCGKSYIGKTSRNICVRIAEHKNTNDDKSSVARHIIATGHQMDWNWQILDRASYDKKLCLKEML